MEEREKEIRLVEHTYFKKDTQKTIDDFEVGDVVFIKIRSPLHYGNREWIFYGKITKITKCFFWITQYAEASWMSDTYCETETIARRDANAEYYAKQWAKDRLLEIWSVTTKQRVDEVTFYHPKRR
jgi:hypothetical protein